MRKRGPDSHPYPKKYALALSIFWTASLLAAILILIAYLAAPRAARRATEQTNIAIAIHCDYVVDAAHPHASDAIEKTDNAPERPWKTIQHGVDVLGAGETLCVKEGVYHESVLVSRSGAAGKDLTITAFPGQHPILDGTGLDLGETGGGFFIDGQSHITIAGFTVRNMNPSILTGADSRPLYQGPAGFRITNASDVTIKGSSTINTASSGIYVQDSTHITLQGNDIRQAVNGGTQECITLDTVTDFSVINNRVHDGVGRYWGGEGIDIKVSSSSGLVAHNTIFDLPGEVGLYIDSYDGYLHDVRVDGNIIYNTAEGITVNAERGGTSANIQITNNLVYHTTQDGIQIGDCCATSEGTKTAIAIVNNTVYHCGYGANDWGGGITIRASTDHLQNVTIINNIASHNNTWQLRDKSGLIQATHNLLYPPTENNGDITGDSPITGSPGFIDADGGDFRLSFLSPAIDKGLATTITEIDITSAARPMGFGTDLGAYETPVSWFQAWRLSISAGSR